MKVLALPSAIPALVVSAASAARLTEEDIQAMERDYAPRVEAATGRAFASLPAVGIASRRELKLSYAQWIRRYAEDAPEDARAMTAASDARVDAAIVLYSYRDRTLYLLSDGVEPLLDSWGFPPEALEPVVRCLVVHELTYALQHQQTNLTWSLDTTDLPEARQMSDGQAGLVQHQVAADLGLAVVEAWLEMSQGLALPASLPEQPGLPGGAGQARLLLAEAEAEGGAEAVWALLSTEAIRSGEVCARAEAVLPDGWREDGPLREAGVATLGLPEEALRIGPSSTAMLRMPSPDWVELREVPVPLAGWDILAGVTPDAPRGLFLAIWRLGIPGDPARLLNARMAQIEETLATSGSFRSYAGETDAREHYMRALGNLEREGLVDAWSWTAGQGPASVHEVWLASETTAVVASASGDAVADPENLVHAAEGVLGAYRALEGDSGPDASEAFAALEAPTPAGPIRKVHPHWTWHVDQIVALTDADDPAGALAEAERGLAGEPGPGSLPLMQLAFLSALGAKDFAAAARTYARADAAGYMTNDLVDTYALVLERDGYLDEAWLLRARLCAQAPDWEGCPRPPLSE
ncbi:MAG: hypothetical protein ABIO70_20745 [Pseudomonadota bacterium]